MPKAPLGLSSSCKQASFKFSLEQVKRPQSGGWAGQAPKSIYLVHHGQQEEKKEFGVFVDFLCEVFIT